MRLRNFGESIVSFSIFFLEMAGLTGKRQFLPRLIRSNGGRIFSQKLHRFPESTPPRVADDSCFAEMHLPGGR